MAEWVLDSCGPLVVYEALDQEYNIFVLQLELELAKITEPIFLFS